MCKQEKANIIHIRKLFEILQVVHIKSDFYWVCISHEFMILAKLIDFPIHYYFICQIMTCDESSSPLLLPKDEINGDYNTNL